MSWNYENYIIEKLLEIQNEQRMSNFSFVIEEEQMFVKRKDYDENTIYIIIKYLSDTKQYGATTQPVQFLILSEQNSLEVAKIIFSNFATKYNWQVETPETDYIKQQYSEPVVLSNFNPVLYGYRSVMYMTGTLYIMRNYTDVTDLRIDGVKIDAINFNFSYTMSTNTQQKSTDNIATSEKNGSTIAITMSIPLIYGALILKIKNTLKGTTSGNDTYAISFYMGDSSESGNLVSHNMKLTSAILTTAPNQVPSFQLGFTL